MKNPILIRPTGLERGIIGLPKDEILDLRDLKLYKCNRFNIEVLEGKKKYAFKDHCSKENTSTIKGKYTTTQYVWLVFEF